MTYSALQKEIEKVKGAKINIREDRCVSNTNCPKAFEKKAKYMENEIFNYDDFIATASDFIKSPFDVEACKSAILSYNRYGVPYQLGKPIELFEDEISINGSKDYNEIEVWVRELGCSEDNLRNAIDAVGNKVEDVRAWLRTH